MNEKELAKALAKEIIYKPLSGIAIVVGLILIFGDFPKDSTDPEDGRSGLRLLKDEQTGIEYLSTRNGGLVRREME